MYKNKKFFIHNSCYIDENVRIGTNTKIWHFSHIQSGSIIGKSTTIGQNVNIGNNVKIGNCVKIQNNVSIYEGVEIEDYVFCGPSMVFTNILLPRSEFPQRGSKHYMKTIVRKSASIGANATIVCGITIGRYALVGAGSVVTKSIPNFGLVYGNPAKFAGWVNEKGQKLKFKLNGKSICGGYLLEKNIVSRL
tara:strand:+ start:339 stop:914 length:576 start_codon:yes stop_codon:yes gene_type:complete